MERGTLRDGEGNAPATHWPLGRNVSDTWPHYSRTWPSVSWHYIAFSCGLTLRTTAHPLLLSVENRPKNSCLAQTAEVGLTGRRHLSERGLCWCGRSNSRAGQSVVR